MKKYTIRQLVEQIERRRAQSKLPKYSSSQFDWEYKEVIKGLEKIDSELRSNESIIDYLDALKNEMKLFFGNNRKHK